MKSANCNRFESLPGSTRVYNFRKHIGSSSASGNINWALKEWSPIYLHPRTYIIFTIALQAGSRSVYTEEEREEKDFCSGIGKQCIECLNCLTFGLGKFIMKKFLLEITLALFFLVILFDLGRYLIIKLKSYWNENDSSVRQLVGACKIVDLAARY